MLSKVTAPEKSWVLVVEDESDIRETLCEILRDEGYETLGVANGREALDALARNGRKPGIILLDLMMPIMDGWGFSKAASAIPEISEIPVLVTTAFPERVNGIPSRAVVKKPIDLELLLELIRRHFSS